MGLPESDLHSAPPHTGPLSWGFTPLLALPTKARILCLDSL